MTIHPIIAAAVFALTIGTARADSPKPIEALPIDLGDVSGVAYYTVERDGFHLVATLAPHENGAAPVRLQAVLASGQTVTFSTPRGVGLQPVTVSIGRHGDNLVVEGNQRLN